MVDKRRISFFIFLAIFHLYFLRRTTTYPLIPTYPRKAI